MTEGVVRASRGCRLWRWSPCGSSSGATAVRAGSASRPCAPAATHDAALSTPESVGFSSAASRAPAHADPGNRGSEAAVGGRHDPGPARQDHRLSHLRPPGRGRRHADDARHDLPRVLDDQAGHRRRDDAPLRAGQVAARPIRSRSTSRSSLTSRYSRAWTPAARWSLEDPVHAPTMQQLMSHTAGFTYGFFGDSPVDKAYQAAKRHAVGFAPGDDRQARQASAALSARHTMGVQPLDGRSGLHRREAVGTVAARIHGAAHLQAARHEGHGFPRALRTSAAASPRCTAATKKGRWSTDPPGGGFGGDYDKTPDMPSGGGGLVTHRQRLLPLCPDARATTVS